MPRIIFLNRYFFPDHSATSQILSDLVFHLASLGHAVSVVTSRQRYDDARAELTPFEKIDGIEIYRVASSRFGRAGIAGRAMDYASFYWFALRKINEIARSGDILVTKTDPPLLSVLGGIVQGSKKVVLINWLQDLYPEVARQLGVPLMRGALYRSLVRVRNRSLQQAQANIAIGTKMAQKVAACGVDPGRIHTIPNWVDEQTTRPVPHASNPLVKEWGLEGKFVVGYSGNLGRAHEFETILRAAEILKNDADIVFLVVGGGRQMPELKRRLSSMGIAASFCFQPYQPEHMLQYSLGVPHVHWISLLPQLEGLIVPSKFYGIAAAGRPTILVGSAEGELGTIIRGERLGFVVRPGDADELAKIVHSLKNDVGLSSEIGLRARQVSEVLFSRQRAFSAWSRVFENIGKTVT